MKTIEGYDVKIFTDNIEENALEQIRELLSIDVFSDKKIRIMPDVHAGAGCVMFSPVRRCHYVSVFDTVQFFCCFGVEKSC